MARDVGATGSLRGTRSGTITRMATATKIQRRSRARRRARPVATAGTRKSRPMTPATTARPTRKPIIEPTSAILPAGKRALDAHDDAEPRRHDAQGGPHEDGALGRVLWVLHDPVGDRRQAHACRPVLRDRVADGHAPDHDEESRDRQERGLEIADAERAE